VLSTDLETKKAQLSFKKVGKEEERYDLKRLRAGDTLV
jgi:hypothetical protein